MIEETAEKPLTGIRDRETFTSGSTEDQIEADQGALTMSGSTDGGALDLLMGDETPEYMTAIHIAPEAHHVLPRPQEGNTTMMT